MKPALKKYAAKFYREVRENIERYGRSLVGCFPDEGETDPVNHAFTYTIGNFEKGLPELLVVGMVDGKAAGLNELSDLMIERGRKFEDGEIVSLGGPVPVCVVDASDSVKAKYTVQVSRYFDHDRYDVMQVVVPDKEGRFPWQKDCAEPYRNIIVHRRRGLH